LGKGGGRERVRGRRRRRRKGRVARGRVGSMVLWKKRSGSFVKGIPREGASLYARNLELLSNLDSSKRRYPSSQHPERSPVNPPPPFSSDTSNKLILMARTVAFAAGRANLDCQSRCMIGRGWLATGARASGASAEAREFGFVIARCARI